MRFPSKFNLWLGPDSVAPSDHHDKENFAATGWSHVCILELIRQNRCGTIVLRHGDPMLVRLFASQRMLPSLFSETEPDSPGDPSLSPLFQLPTVTAPHAWVERIALNKDPWIVSGVSEPTPGELFILARLAAAGAEIHWVQRWHEPVPKWVKFPVQSIAGHDTDTFLAGLLGEFPPGGIQTKPGDDPEASLQQDLLKRASAFRSDAQIARGEPWQSMDPGRLDDDAFREAIARLRFQRALAKRLGDHPGVFAVTLVHCAEKTSARRADQLLEIAYEDWRSEPRKSGWQGVRQTSQLVTILRHRAQLRRPKEAQPFFEEGDAALRALPAKEPREHNAAMEIADFLAAWAATQEPDEAGVLIQEAVDILGRPRVVELKRYEESPLWTKQWSILRAHALRLSAADAKPFFDAAKVCADKIEELENKPAPGELTFSGLERRTGMHEYFLAFIAAEEARLDPTRQTELLETAAKHFQAFLEASPKDRAMIYYDRGAALAFVARERKGEESDRLHEQVYDLFRQSEESGDFAMLQDAWGAVLVRQASTKTGDLRSALLEQAHQHAVKANQMDPDRGTYNLACIAAEHRDWDQMSKLLRLAARGPKFPGPAHIDNDPNFASVRNEPWFQQFVADELAPA
jgi:hypothetical protein